VLLLSAGPYIKWFLEKLGHEGLNKMLGRWNAVCTLAAHYSSPLLPVTS